VALDALVDISDSPFLEPNSKLLHRPLVTTDLLQGFRRVLRRPQLAAQCWASSASGEVT